MLSVSNSLTTHAAHIARFAGAGGLATAVHWLLMTGLVLLKLPALLATVVGSIAGAGVNYVLQRHLAFRHRHDHPQQGARYVIACLLLWLANAMVFWIANVFLVLVIWQSQLLASAATALLAYCLYQFLVFVGELRS